MKNSIWAEAIANSADPARVRHFVQVLTEAGAGDAMGRLPPEGIRIVTTVLAGSRALGNLLVFHPEWLQSLELERIRFPRRAEGLRNEASEGTNSFLEQRETAAALRWLRRFRQKETLRIAARDLAGLGNVPEITRELSDLADVILSAVWRISYDVTSLRYGRPWHTDQSGNWTETASAVLGLGKLGGQELNYSSDVDVMFLYDEEGQVFKEPPRKGRTPRSMMPSHQFFNRVAEAFIAEISGATAEGSLFRIDLRLRPEGASGPLCRSLGSYENYYAQWGQTWERMMLIKARGVAGSSSLAGEFLEMVQPFRYPRTFGEDVVYEIAVMKDRIESEVLRSGEIERNVKLGRGGIREIEFIVQSQQLLHAGRIPFLQGAQTLPTLGKLARYGLLTEEKVRELTGSYCFLRTIEHRLQMEENLQTHTIPEGRPARERLARLMKFPSWRDLDLELRSRRDGVRKVFNRLFRTQRKPSRAEELPSEFSGAEAEWTSILSRHSFRDPVRAFAAVREFVEGPGYVHVSQRTAALARRLLPRFFAICPKRSSKSVPGGKRDSAAESQEPFQLSDPDRVLTRLDSFIAAYGARAVLFELWNSNPTIFDLLVKLFDRSEFLAELAIRTPDMVDELVTSGRLRRRKGVEETLRDLRHGREDDDQLLWMRRYHQVELMRIGLRDILGLADPEQYLAELSALAEASLQYALEVTLRRHRLKAAPIAIIGLGKLGGREIDYGSDLDIVFVADEKAKDLRKLQQAALDVMDLLSKRTELGIVFQTDARLRPDGEKGLLLNSLRAFEDYYRKRAQLWEIQALSRCRFVAGDVKVGQRFEQLSARLADFSRPDLPLSAFSTDWKQAMHRMRMRIERERTPAGKDELAIKTGKGGFMDAEFIAQALCLEHGWREPNTLRALEKGSDAGVLPGVAKLITAYRELRRVEGILRRWSYEGETVLPDDPAPYYRVSVRCGFSTPEEFRSAVADWRQEMRAAYSRVFPY